MILSNYLSSGVAGSSISRLLSGAGRIKKGADENPLLSTSSSSRSARVNWGILIATCPPVLDYEEMFSPS